MAVFCHFLSVLAVYLIVLGAGAKLSFPLALVIVPTVLAAAMLPISFGGWGAREAAMIAGLQAVGIAPEAALAASFTLGIILLGTGMLGGVVWLLHRRTVTDSMRRTF